MKRVLFLTFAMLCTVVQSAWAQTEVSTDKALRNAIADKANITVTADIILSNETLSIPEGATVTINLNNHTLDRKLTKRGEGGGHFRLQGISAGDLPANAIELNFDGDATGIRNLPPALSEGEGAWYDLQGSKLSGTPTQKGIYICNGRKRVIK